MNWIAIAVAALATFAIGYVWYGMIFKNAWIAETGMTEEKQKQGNMALTFGLSLVFAFLLAMFLYNFVWHDDDPSSHNFKHGMAHGLFLCLFTVLPTLGTNALYEQKSWKYILINVGYWIVSAAVMGGILNVWR